MKRLLVLAVVGLLVVTAGCAMTSPEADQARQTSQTTTTTASGSGSDGNPHGSAPAAENLPDGYSEESVENASLAYEQHMSILASDSFHLTYLKNSSDTSGTLQAITNASGPDDTWVTTIGTRNGPVTKAIYQDGDTRYVQNVAPDGLKSVESSTEPYQLTDGVVGNESLEAILEEISISSPRTMTQGNTTFIFYKVDALGDQSVSGGHFVILPNGQIRIIYLKYDNTEIAYTAVNQSLTVEEPNWVQSAS